MMKRLFLLLLLLLLTFCSSKKEKYKELSGIDKEHDREIVKVVLKENDRPKILVLPKAYKSNDIFDDIAVNRVCRYLGDLGFDYANIESTIGTLKDINSVTKSQTIQDIALKANTAYYITVQAEYSEQGIGVEDAYFSSSTVVLNAFSTETGIGVGSSTKMVGPIGSIISQEKATKEAILESAKSASKDIVDQIMYHFQRYSQKGFLYDVKVYGIKDYKHAKIFKQVLQDNSDIEGDIRMSKFNDYYRFEFYHLSSSSESIIDDIFSSINDEEGFENIDLKNVSGKQINFIIK